jgi:hypothetical protein
MFETPDSDDEHPRRRFKLFDILILSIPMLFFNSIVLFQPKVKWIPGEHKVPGGGFPMPPVASELCQILPPPASFNGPFVIVDKLMDVFNKTEFPEEFPGINFS